MYKLTFSLHIYFELVEIFLMYILVIYGAALSKLYDKDVDLAVYGLFYDCEYKICSYSACL